MTQARNAADLVNSAVLGGNLTIGNTTISATSVASDAFAPNATFGGFMRNRIINGDMRIDQRNAGAAVTTSSGGVWAIDRWFSQSYAPGTGITVTSQRVTDGPTNTGLYNSVKFLTTSANSDNNFYIAHTQRIEGYSISGIGFLNGGNSVLSFWVKSSKTGNYSISLHTGYRSGASYAVAGLPVYYTIIAANTWEYKTIVIPTYTSGLAAWQYDSNIGLELQFYLGIGSAFSGQRSDPVNTWVDLSSAVGYFYNSTNANQSWGKTLNDSWQITGVQLEAGSTATQFERRPYGMELALCQRYYEVVVNDNGFGFYNGTGSTITMGVTTFYKVTKRATPTVSVGYGAVNVIGLNSVTTYQGNIPSGTWYYPSGVYISAEL
jgi:hypothetical protein